MAVQLDPLQNIVGVQWNSGDFAVGANDPASLTNSNGLLRYIRAGSGEVRWSVSPGIGNIVSIKAGQDGSMVVGGNPRASSPTPGNVFPCVALAKMNRNGGVLWTRFDVPSTPGVSIPDAPATAQVVATDIDSNSFVILGNAFSGATFGAQLWKLSPGGATIWALPIQGPSVATDDAVSILNGACDSSGNLWCIVVQGAVSSDIRLQCYSGASGAIIHDEFITEVTTDIDQLGTVIAVDRDDNILFGTPSTVQKRTIGGFPVWSFPVTRPLRMGVDAQGNVYVTEFVDPLAPSAGSMLKIATIPEGAELVWSQTLTNQEMRIAVNAAGQTMAAIAILTESYNKDGDFLWAGGDSFFITPVESWSKRFNQPP
jgi:hypothetical protein